MDKEILIQELKASVSQGTITKDELLLAYDDALGRKHTSFLRNIGIADILYYIGGAVVFVGIVVLVGQHWDELSPIARVLVTLGFAVVAYSCGGILDRVYDFGRLSVAFFFVAMLVLPVGLFVLFDNAGYEVGAHGVQSAVSGVLLAVALFSYFGFKKEVFTFFSIIFSTWFFFAFTNMLVGGNPLFTRDFDFNAYRVLVVGASYLSFGYWFSQIKKPHFSGFLYSFGSIGFLGAALALGKWQPSQNIFWELIFPFLTFGAMFVSVYLKQKSFLVWGAIFLMGYIGKITGEYFSKSLGWPIALIVAGFALIFIGYGAYYINKRYLRQEAGA